MVKKNTKDKIRSVKGMHDMFMERMLYHERIEREARRVAEYYGFSPIRTPHLEPEELFTTSLGETSEVIEKQMYTFSTRGGTRVAMRPEGTAGALRAYMENGLQSQAQPARLFYSGAFFRHENPQAGRTREFWQSGIESIGDAGPVHDALTIRVLISILEAVGLKDSVVHINNIGDKVCRAQYMKELTAYYRKRQQQLCPDCKKRLKDNPLRLLDCKVYECVELRKGAPQIIDHLSEDCKKRFREVIEFLDGMDINYRMDPYLVRGLDYYTNTVFEIFPGEEESEDEEKEGDEKKQKASISALGGGGRYDGLAKMLFRKDIPAVGGALGIDRVALEMKRKNIKPRSEPAPKVFLIQMGAKAKGLSFVLLEDLRKAGIVNAHDLAGDSLTAQLRKANDLEVPFSLIIGQKEAIDKQAILRDMKTGTQELVSFDKIPTTIKMKLRQL